MESESEREKQREKRGVEPSAVSVGRARQLSGQRGEIVPGYPKREPTTDRPTNSTHHNKHVIRFPNSLSPINRNIIQCASSVSSFGRRHRNYVRRSAAVGDGDGTGNRCSGRPDRPSVCVICRSCPRRELAFSCRITSRCNRRAVGWSER